MGVLSIMHPEAEPAAARAAAAQGVPYILSSASSTPMEEVAEAMGDGERWFQLYWAKDREVTRSFLNRAKAAGYTALFVTLDTPLLAWRPRDLDQAYLPFLHGVGTANYFTDPAFRAGLAKPVQEDPNAAVMHFVGMFADPAKTWPDLAFLRENWDGPIVLKGILHPEDALRAAEAGMDGVVVSNHGGRQVAGSVAAADALPRVVEAAADRLTVLFDSGIRTGDDIFKALALGAKSVLVGRPYAYGLGLDGQAGVEHVIRCLLAEFDLTLALSGHSRPRHADRRRPHQGIRMTTTPDPAPATEPQTVNNVLAVVSPHVGGRAAGAALAGLFPGQTRVTVVESSRRGPGGPARRPPPHHRPGSGHRRTPRRRTVPGARPVRQSRLRLRRPGRGPRTGHPGLQHRLQRRGEAERRRADLRPDARPGQAAGPRPHGPRRGRLGTAAPPAVHHRAVRQDPRHHRPGPHRRGSRPPGRRVRHGPSSTPGRGRWPRRPRPASAAPATSASTSCCAPPTTSPCTPRSPTRPVTSWTRNASPSSSPPLSSINTARGALIDQDALADALTAGALAGAGIDVFDPEPPTAALRLLKAPNVVLSPHVAGVTRETLVRIALAAVQNVIDHLAGKPLRDIVS